MSLINKITKEKARQRWSKIVDSGKMKCSRCNEVRPLSGFRLLSKSQIEKRGYVAYISHCNECDAKRTALYKNNKIKTIQGKVDFLFSNISRRCRDKNHKLDFGKEYLIHLWEKQGGKCFYTDVKMSLGSHNSRKDLYNLNFKNVSVDRVDSRIGYTKDNIVLCCWGVNNMKQQMDYDEFIKWAELLIIKVKNGKKEAAKGT